MTSREAASLLQLTRQMTDRDRKILGLVWDHRVLTTPQIAALFFTGERRARERLNDLLTLRALERFRPWVPNGSAPYHWVLGPVGARALASHRGRTPAEIGYRRSTALGICTSQHLTHQVGVNEFFVRLHARARTTTTTELARWWHEDRCARLWGDHARPDAYGQWTHVPPEAPPVAVDFFLEHDTGSVTLAKVAAKINGYAALADATGITTPVLFWLPGSRRETHLRQHLGNPEIPVATAVHAPDPSQAVWLPAGDPAGPRLQLIDLAHAWPDVKGDRTCP